MPTTKDIATVLRIPEDHKKSLRVLLQDDHLRTTYRDFVAQLLPTGDYVAVESELSSWLKRTSVSTITGRQILQVLLGMTLTYQHQRLTAEELAHGILEQLSDQELSPETVRTFVDELVSEVNSLFVSFLAMEALNKCPKPASAVDLTIQTWLLQTRDGRFIGRVPSHMLRIIPAQGEDISVSLDLTDLRRLQAQIESAIRGREFLRMSNSDIPLIEERA